MAAFRDLERLTRGFANDLRKVAWDSGTLGGDVLATLHEILDEALERIKAEVRASSGSAPAGSASAGTAPPAGSSPDSQRGSPAAPDSE